jgi:putative flippase GtrA
MNLWKQGASYGLVGVIQIGADWLLFVLLTQFGVASAIANVAGRVSGATLGFVLNGKWTFASEGKAALRIKHLGRYSVSWAVMTLLSTLVVSTTAHFNGLHMAWLVKPIADLALAALGFTASKYWIYR